LLLNVEEEVCDDLLLFVLPVILILKHLTIISRHIKRKAHIKQCLCEGDMAYFRIVKILDVIERFKLLPENWVIFNLVEPIVDFNLFHVGKICTVVGKHLQH